MRIYLASVTMRTYHEHMTQRDLSRTGSILGDAARYADLSDITNAPEKAMTLSTAKEWTRGGLTDSADSYAPFARVAEQSNQS